MHFASSSHNVQRSNTSVHPCCALVNHSLSVQMQEVNNLINEMANRISRGGILLQPVFCDFDRRREMCVAKDQVDTQQY
jgi:hypothetical protein